MLFLFVARGTWDIFADPVREIAEKNIAVIRYNVIETKKMYPFFFLL